MIYFVQPVRGGRIKIGTTVRLTERLRTLTREWGEDLRVLAVKDGSFDEEYAIHKQFSHLDMGGEWFEPEIDLLQFIESEGKSWDGVDECPRAVTVKIDRTLAAKAKYVAGIRKMTLVEYLTEIQRGPITRDFDKAIKENGGK